MQNPKPTSMPRTSRRALLKAAAASIAVPMINFGAYRVFAASDRKYSARALALVQRSYVIDMLAPLSLNLSPAFFGSILPGKDAEAFRASGIKAFHHSVGMRGADAYGQALAYFAGSNGFVARNSDLFALVTSIADMDRATRQRRIAVIMGLQNSEHFRTVEDVPAFYQLGQRCSQLTYNWQNLIGSGSTERVDGGVSDFGAAIIGKMNEVGMLVDVSHCGARTTLDAIDISVKPIAITHSNCRALNDHPRLKADEAIKKLAAKGGVMGITGVRNFVRDREPTSVEHIVDHMDHVVKIAGVEFVGIGSDADLYGYDDLPAELVAQLKAANKSSYGFRDKSDTDGFDHPRKVFDLTESLLHRGYSDANIEAILGGNFRRLLGEVWK